MYEVALREVDPDGKVLLFPEVGFSGYWSSIANVEEVIKLYRGHATSEQFHKADVLSNIAVEKKKYAKQNIFFVV